MKVKQGQLSSMQSFPSALLQNWGSHPWQHLYLSVAHRVLRLLRDGYLLHFGNRHSVTVNDVLPRGQHSGKQTCL